MPNRPFIALLLWITATAAAAATELQTLDIDVRGTQDLPAVGRIAGSHLVMQRVTDYDEYEVALGPVDGGKFQKKVDIDGQRTRMLYALPSGAGNVSVLDVMRNLQRQVASQGGKLLYDCKSWDCGAIKYYFLGRDVISMDDRLLWCIQPQVGAEPWRLSTFELPDGGGYAVVLAYTFPDNWRSDCRRANGRIFVMMDVVQSGALQQRVVVLKAEEMAQAMNTGGRVALYGLYFDSNEAEVKPESRDTLAQMARLLQSDPSLRVLVVGHTDNVGGLAFNQDLSRRRAEAVARALVAQYRIDARRLTPLGVSFASPMASNRDEEGRAKNRRVELVPN